jgi:hypothetical protein
LSPTPPNTARGAGRSIALGKIGGNVVPVDLKVKLTGVVARAFADYQRAYKAAHGEDPDKEALAASMIQAFIESDKGFAAWRRANREAEG